MTTESEKFRWLAETGLSIDRRIYSDAPLASQNLTTNDSAVMTEDWTHGRVDIETIQAIDRCEFDICYILER